MTQTWERRLPEGEAPPVMDATILPDRTDRERDVLAVAGAFAVVVTMPAGRHRRRVYLSLSAAEKAVRRAERRGQAAAVVLCTLQPVRVIGVAP